MGGYEAVTERRRWWDVAELLLPETDALAMTVRVVYERCMLDFEEYMAGGQYESELANGTLPATSLPMDSEICLDQPAGETAHCSDGSCIVCGDCGH